MFWKSSQNSRKNLRSSHPEVFYQRMFWKIFQNSQKNIFRNIFFNKVAGWKPETLRSRHFSHVTKSHIFKNLNLKAKADRKICSNSLENHFRQLKLYSNPPSCLARSRCQMNTFWKNPQKLVFLLNLRLWPAPKRKICSIFYGERFI